MMKINGRKEEMNPKNSEPCFGTSEWSEGGRSEPKRNEKVAGKKALSVKRAESLISRENTLWLSSYPQKSANR